MLLALRATLAVLVCIACATSLARVDAAHTPPGARHTIRLFSGHINVHSSPSLGARLRSEPMHHEIHTLADTTSARRQHFFVHVTRNLQKDERDGLALMLGAHEMHYVPHNTFIVYARTADVLRAEASHELVDWAGVVEAAHKHVPGIAEWLQFKAKRVDEEVPFSATRHYAPRGVAPHPAEERVVLRAELGSDARRTKADVEALAEAFVAALDARGDLSDDVDAYAASARVLVARAPAGVQAETVLAEMRALHEVLSVSPGMPQSTHNAAAAQITQGNVVLDEFAPPTSRPLSLTGKDVLVAIADTGIDYDHCMFRDPNTPVPVTNDAEDPAYDANHRKIHSYVVLATQGDYPDGHGTHTAGSIAGEVLGGANADAARFNGMAYESRLVFQDIGDGETLEVPDDIETYLFEPAAGLGATIHSNSWGCSAPQGSPPTLCAEYLDQARQVDHFMHSNDKVLVLFANGNANSPLFPARTVGSPATCKNCLSVGASMSAKAGWRDVVNYMDWEDWAIENGFSSSQECCDEATSKDGNWFCCRSHMADVIDEDDAIFGAPINPDQMATFSSTGPAPKERFKPDLVAPGMFITSAHSDGLLTTNQCGTGAPDMSNSAALLSMMGTSMATPVTAGTAALLSEHLTSMGEDVTAPLLKAMLINSARQMGGEQLSRGVWTNLEVSPHGTPDNTEGYGRVDLSNVMSPSHTYYRTNSIAEDGRGDTYSLNNVGAVYVTLVWSDVAGVTQADDPLVNNLDLTVTLDNTLYDFAHIANDNNNVEGLSLVAAGGGQFQTVEIMVGGNDIPVGPQQYTIVITTDVALSVVSQDGVVYTKKSYHKGTNGAVIGGVIGALLAAILIAGAVLFVRGRKARTATGNQTLLAAPAPQPGMVVQQQQQPPQQQAAWPPQPVQPAYPGQGPAIYATPPQL